MNTKIREIRANPSRLRIAEVRPRRPSREIVAELMVERKSYNHARFAAKGRFINRAELIAYLSDEILKGDRPRREIAEDAQIPYTTLTGLVQSGKLNRVPELKS